MTSNSSELVGVPHLPMLCFKDRSAPQLGVDLGDDLSADGFSWVGHAWGRWGHADLSGVSSTETVSIHSSSPSSMILSS
jgi:hypothetical protein